MQKVQHSENSKHAFIQQLHCCCCNASSIHWCEDTTGTRQHQAQPRACEQTSTSARYCLHWAGHAIGLPELHNSQMTLAFKRKEKGMI